MAFLTYKEASGVLDVVKQSPRTLNKDTAMSRHSQSFSLGKLILPYGLFFITIILAQIMPTDKGKIVLIGIRTVIEVILMTLYQ